MGGGKRYAVFACDQQERDGGSIAAGRTIDQEAVDVTTKRLWLEVAVGVSVLMNVYKDHE